MVWREKESFPVHLAYQLRDEVHAKIIHFKLTSSRFWSVTTIEREITFGMIGIKLFQVFFFDFLFFVLGRGLSGLSLFMPFFHEVAYL